MWRGIFVMNNDQLTPGSTSNKRYPFDALFIFIIGWFFGILVAALIILVAVLMVCVAILAIPGVPFGMAASAWYKGAREMFEGKGS